MGRPWEEMRGGAEEGVRKGTGGSERARGQVGDFSAGQDRAPQPGSP